MELNNLSTLNTYSVTSSLVWRIKFNCWIELKLVTWKVRNFPLKCHSYSKVCGYTAFKLNESYTKHCVHEISFPLASIMFHMVHTVTSLKEWTSLVQFLCLVSWIVLEWLYHHWITAGEGWDAPVELTGRFPAADGVALLVKAGGTGLSTGKAGISSAWRFELKGWWEFGGRFHWLFLSLPSASNSK